MKFRDPAAARGSAKSSTELTGCVVGGLPKEAAALVGRESVVAGG
jgi:hypothetical protein